jgi:serine protease Do
MDGDVVGINSAIFSPSGGSVGIGFSIPSNLARDVIQQLRQFGVARRGWIGVRIQGVSEEVAEAMHLPGTQGALIAGVTDDGPAAKAGLNKGDLVTGFDSKPITDFRNLSRIVAATPIGKNVNVDVLRSGRKVSLHLVVAKLDEEPAAAKVPNAPNPPGNPSGNAPKPQSNNAPPSKLSQLGLSLSPLDGASRAKFKLPANVEGVVVSDVSPDSPAADKNIRPGDVIVEVQNQKVKSPGEVENRISADIKAGRKVELMLVSRGGDSTYVGLRLD